MTMGASGNGRALRRLVTLPLVVALVLSFVACDPAEMWFAPNTNCSEWARMPDENRSGITDHIIRGGSLFERVRTAQHAAAGTSEEQLVAMAVASVTKSCELQRWSPMVLVKDIVRGLYVPASGKTGA